MSYRKILGATKGDMDQFAYWRTRNIRRHRKKKKKHDGDVAPRFVHPWFLGEFAKSRKSIISFLMSVRLFTWNNSARTGPIFVKFDIDIISRISVEKIQVSWTPDKNNLIYMKANLTFYSCLSVLLRMRNISNYKVWLSRLTQPMMLQIFILRLQLFRPSYEAIIRSRLQRKNV
jgi:hypothetical protein